MSSFGLYLLKMGLGLWLCYPVYRYFLRKETFFEFNRWYLVFSISFSMLLPLIDLSFVFNSSQEGIKIAMQVLPVITVGSEYARAMKTLTFTNIALLIYCLGCVFVFVRFIIQFFQLWHIFQSSQVKIINNHKVFVVHKTISPFSFFNFIFISNETYNSEDFEKIIIHESAHGQQLHSLDLLFVEILSILQWFNPIVWLYRKSLKETHEYLADEAVLEQGCNITRYRLLLLNQAVGIPVSLASNLNKTLTLKRLIMMEKQKSSPISRLKIVAALPVIALMLIAYACSDVADEAINKQSATQNEYNAQNPKSDADDKTPISQTSPKEEFNAQNAEVDANGNPIFMIVEEMPEYPGGEDALRSFLVQNIKYPAEARDKGITGKVYIKFCVTSNGKVDLASVVRGVNPQLDAEAMRVVQSLPDWQPGKQRGKAVSVWYTIPIKFALQ